MSAAAGTPDLSGVPAAQWLEARRRHAAIRALAETPERTRADAEATAAVLGIDISFVYKLLARYEADPRVTSMLPRRRGRRDGDLVLAAEVDEVIQSAIDEMFLTRQRPRVSDLVTEIRRAAGRSACRARAGKPCRSGSTSARRERFWQGARAARPRGIGSPQRPARSMRPGHCR